MNPTAVYSKSGKGVQEASGRTNLLKRPERAVLSAIDGRANLGEVAQKVGRAFDASFQHLITQLDRDGFIREVASSGRAATSAEATSPRQPNLKSAPARAAAPPPSGSDDLDFTSIMPAVPKPAPKPDASAAKRAKEQESALIRARQEAEARAQAERDRLRSEAESKARAEAEAKFRAEAEKKLREEAEARVKAEAEAKAKAAREEAMRIAAEAKAKAEAEARAAKEKAEAEARAAKEKAEAEARARIEAERRAREEAERKAREEAERARAEAERARREAEELRQRLEEERKAREETERARREEEEARRKEEEARRQAETKREIPTLPAQKEPDLGDLVADLNAFEEREANERRAAEAAQAKARAERERQERAERERRQQEEEQRRIREEQARRAQQEEARRAREEAEREQARLEQEEEDRRRRAREVLAAAAAKAEADAQAPAESVVVTEDDLGMDDVRRDQAAISKESRKSERERRREARQQAHEVKERERAAARIAAAAGKKLRRRTNWGRQLTMTLLVIAIGGAALVQFVPLPTAEYQHDASQALGQPVKIASAHFSVLTGVRFEFDGVRIGEAGRIAKVRAYPRLTSLLGGPIGFSRLELDGAALPQQALGDALFARLQGGRFAVDRIVASDLKLLGPLAIPPLHADAKLGPDGRLASAVLTGPDELFVKVTPRAGKIDIEATAASFTPPIAPRIILGSFAMKGWATRQQMHIDSWGGALFDGAISGSANLRWGNTWQVDGAFSARAINAAVFAPALLSEGRADATARFAMAAAQPDKLADASRIDGRFVVNKGVLGSFDLSRAIQTNGRESRGSTPFVVLTGQASYDRGIVELRNVALGAGALQAGASADIARNGGLTGRIIADVHTASQTLRATLNLAGTVKEPQVRD